MRGSVTEWWFHTCLKCIGIVVSGSEVPSQAVSAGGANDRRSVEVLLAHWSVSMVLTHPHFHIRNRDTLQA